MVRDFWDTLYISYVKQRWPGVSDTLCSSSQATANLKASPSLTSPNTQQANFPACSPHSTHNLFITTCSEKHCTRLLMLNVK